MENKIQIGYSSKEWLLKKIIYNRKCLQLAAGLSELDEVLETHSLFHKSFKSTPLCKPDIIHPMSRGVAPALHEGYQNPHQDFNRAAKT